MVLPVIYELIASLVPLAGKCHLCYCFPCISTLCKFKLWRFRTRAPHGSMVSLAGIMLSKRSQTQILSDFIYMKCKDRL